MNSTDSYAYYPILGRVAYGKEAVEKSIKQVNVINPFLVTTPSTLGKRVHPIFTDEFGSRAYNQLLRNRRLINRIALVYLFLIPTFMFAFGFNKIACEFIVGILLIYICGLYELRYIYADQGRLASKVAFYTNTLQPPKGLIYAWIGFFGIIGLAQLILIFVGGSQEYVLSSLGLIFQSAFSGQYYRFVTGSLVHGSFLHWALNLMTLVWFALLCQPITRRWTLLLAVGISVASNLVIAGLAQILTLPYEGVIGFSGGIAGLAGIIVGASIANHPAIPEGLHMSMLPILIVTFFCFSFATSASTLLHFVGMSLGSGIGVAIAVKLRGHQVRNT